jgi:ribosomal protein L37AE/L43A
MIVIEHCPYPCTYCRDHGIWWSKTEEVWYCDYCGRVVSRDENYLERMEAKAEKEWESTIEKEGKP